MRVTLAAYACQHGIMSAASLLDRISADPTVMAGKVTGVNGGVEAWSATRLPLEPRGEALAFQTDDPPIDDLHVGLNRRS